jgi:hypothetical protein
MPVMFKNGTQGKTQEGFKNVLDNREHIPPNGWNGEPPGPTGEPVRQASDAYRQNYDQINWDTPGPKQPGKVREIWPPFAKIYMEA